MTVSRPPTYVYSTGNLPGTVAAKNFLSLVNPTGSGKLFVLGGFFVSSTSTGASSATSSMRGLRVSEVAADGTDKSADITKFITAHPDSVAEVQIDNPTFTVGGQLFNVPPPTSAAASSKNPTQITNPVAAPFILTPGEGFGMRTNAGGTEQRWNISVVWAEVDP